jgi:hypothetical protein
MRTQIFILIVGVISLVGNVQGVLIWDSGDHVFSEGSEDFIEMYNDATATISGGEIWEFYMYDNTTADITGGEIGILLGQNYSLINVYDGSNTGLLKPNDFSTANIYGGEINHLFVLGNSTTNVYGGNFPMGFSANNSALIKMYVLEYNWDPDGGSSSGFGLLTGTWLNSGELFSIDYVDLDCFDNIVFVPEPSMILLLGFGFLVLRNRK